MSANRLKPRLMGQTKHKHQFFASCPAGLEGLLRKEIDALGAKSSQMASGGVHFDSYPEIGIQAILRSRIASRVYKKLYSFEIKTEKDLYFNIRDIKWKGVFEPEQTFKIQVLQGKSPKGTRHSQFKSPLYLGQVAKDGIVDRFRKDLGERPSVDKDLPDNPLLIRVEPNDNPHSRKENVTVSLDICGQPLSNRGYRGFSVEAPLRENLAAAMALKAGVSEQDDLYNPMCGSGTIMTEALLVKGKIPPSYLRVKRHLSGGEKEWAFLGQNFYAKDKYLRANTEKFLQEIIAESEEGIQNLKKSRSQHIALDIDESALKAAKTNMDILGLGASVELLRADALEYEAPGFKGKILANPPYGERLQEKNLEGLYRDFGERLKRSFKGSTAYVLTANLPMIKKIQLQTKERVIVYNGNLESRLVRYDLF